MKAIIKLFRIKISLAVSLSALAGYFLAIKSMPSGLNYERADAKALLLCLGIFLLAAGASALNQVQEKNLDSLMERTRSRPLPGKKISVKSALFLAFFFLLSGLTIFYLGFHLLVFGLALISIFLYNGIYIHLKTKTSIAIIPGAVVGSMPFIIGWFSAGKFYKAPQLLIGAVFILVWQVAHTFILVNVYRKEYEKMNLPFGFVFFSREQLKRLSLIWYINSVLLVALFPLFGMLEFFYVALLAGISLIYFVSFIGKVRGEKYLWRLHNYYNFFLLGVFILMILN